MKKRNPDWWSLCKQLYYSCFVPTLSTLTNEGGGMKREEPSSSSSSSSPPDGNGSFVQRSSPGGRILVKYTGHRNARLGDRDFVLREPMKERW